ncbi:MAG: hypothetical protein K0R27_2143 [Xanthobacteraceae bacterium]|jgi:hypothetical protein|nr:hypothetical protein [Xanthobacteraceae bacterium]
MVRIALSELLLFLAPFVLFALYLRFGRGLDSLLAGWSTTAFAVCTLIAVALVAGSLFFIEWEGRGPTKGRYVPPTWQDGVLTPGHVE